MVALNSSRSSVAGTSVAADSAELPVPRSGCLQIQPNQFPGDFQEISRIFFFKSGRFVRYKAYNIKMQVKFIISINEHVMMSSDQRHAYLQYENILILYTCLPYEQCTKNSLTCENYIANYKNFSRASTTFQEISGISRSCRHRGGFPHRAGPPPAADRRLQPDRGGKDVASGPRYIVTDY